MEHRELEDASKLADAELGVAEDLGWVIALLAACTAYLASGHWLLILGAGVIAYWLATTRYRRRAAAAEDAYFKVAKLGKYMSPLPNPTPHRLDSTGCVGILV